jgi:hypothetical protein
MNPTRIVTGAIVALSIASGTAFAQEPVAIKRTFKEGETSRYKVVVNANVQGMEIVATNNVRFKIKEIRKDGNIVIEQTNEGGTVNIGGMEQQQPETPTTSSVRDKNFKLVEMKPDEIAAQLLSPEMQKLAAMVGEVVYPEKTVKAGESWEVVQDNPMVKGKKFTMKMTFVGVEKVDGADLYKVKQTATADTSADGSKLELDVTNWMVPATGEVVRLTGKMKGVVTNFGPMDWELKQEKLKDDAKAEKKP